MGATSSKENYLKTILCIMREKGSVRASEIAAAMHVTRPSVSHAVHQLEDEQYIRIGNDRSILLTAEGYRLAASVLERYETFYRLFLSLGVSKETASLDAERIEHAISDDSFSRLKDIVPEG